MSMTAIVDAHQHFWNYGTYQTSWMQKPPYAGDPAFTPIQRSFGPADLQPELQAAGVFASVTVQAADNSEENDILLAHAAQTPWIAGVVGWIPLDRPDEAALMLERFSRKQKFVGVQHFRPSGLKIQISECDDFTRKCLERQASGAGAVSSSSSSTQ